MKLTLHFYAVRGWYASRRTKKCYTKFYRNGKTYAMKPQYFNTREECAAAVRAAGYEVAECE